MSPVRRCALRVGVHAQVRRRSVLLACGPALISLVSVLFIAPSARAQFVEAPFGRKPVVSIAVNLPEVLRADRLAEASVVFTGVDARTQVRVDWGDGGTPEKERGSCGTKGAVAYPAACTVTMVPGYSSPGTYTVTASTGQQRVSKTITVAAAPTAWSPPASWVQPAGWSMIWTQATYTPCQKVDWYFDRTGEPGDRVRMREDVAAVLASLGAASGLNFVETADPGQADLTLKWESLGYRGPDTAGIGGPIRPGKASVSFSPTNYWTADAWAGRGYLRVDRPDLGQGWYSTGIGRQSLVLHEVMHALGFGHLSDETSIMNPSVKAPDLSAGDLDGLRTMYANNPCPAIPD